MKTVAGGTRAGGLVVCSVVFVVIAFLMVLSRLYTRIKIVRNPGVDDSCVVIALVRCLYRQWETEWLTPLDIFCGHVCNDASAGQIRSGPARAESHGLAALDLSQAILRIYHPLLPGLVIHQDLDPAAVSTYLSAGQVPEELLYHARSCHHLCAVVCS